MPEAPGGMTSIGNVSSSGKGSVVAAIVGWGMAANGDGAKELGSDSGSPGLGSSGVSEPNGSSATGDGLASVAIANRARAGGSHSTASLAGHRAVVQQ